MFYDVFSELCERRGISCKRAAMEIGLSNSIAAKWKRTGGTPNGETLNKIASYFNVSVGYLLGEETEKAPTETGRRHICRDDIMFALARGNEDVITDEMFEEIQNFADYVIQREAAKKKKEQ